MTFRAHIGIDFEDAWGERRTSFQLLNSESKAVAVVHYTEGDIERSMIDPALLPRVDGIMRLASIAVAQHRRTNP